MQQAPSRSSLVWLSSLAFLLLLTASETVGRVPLHPPILSGGGGGVVPFPPSSTALSGGAGAGTSPPKRVHHRNNPAPPVSVLELPLLVGISGPASFYNVVITNASGAVVTSGQTNGQGMLELTVPALSGLELDVLDTTVVGLPIYGGQAVLITIP